MSWPKFISVERIRPHSRSPANPITEDTDSPSRPGGSLLGWRERVYSYHEVDLVRSAPRFKGPTGKVISEPAIEIGFSDGHRWSTVRDPVGMTGTQVSRVASLVASRAGKDVEKFEILEWNAP